MIRERIKRLWPPYRRRKESEAIERMFWQDRARALNELHRAGWTDWCASAPPPWAQLVEVVRLKDYSDHAYKPAIISPSGQSPLFNIADLWWRPIDPRLPVLDYRTAQEREQRFLVG